METLNFDYAANPEPYALPMFHVSQMNPHSNHKVGHHAALQLQAAQDQVRRCFPNFASHEVRFIPGGGSLANRLAILQTLPWSPRTYAGQKRDLVLIGSTEHQSIRQALEEELLFRGYRIKYLPVTRNGQLDLKYLETFLREYRYETAFVSIGWVNNETGVIQPMKKILQMVRDETEAVIHSDGAHAVHLLSQLSEEDLVPDLVTFSLYKVRGPHLGLLLRASHLPFREVYLGTPDVKQIAFGGLALEKYQQEYAKSYTRLVNLKNYLDKKLRDLMRELMIPYTVLSSGKISVPHLYSILLPPGFDGKTIQSQLSELGLLVSSGSACSASSKEGSHVLTAMGYTAEESYGEIRFSFPPSHTQELVDSALTLLEKMLIKIKQIIQWDTLRQRDEEEAQMTEESMKLPSRPTPQIRRLAAPLDLKLPFWAPNSFRLSEGESYLKKANYKRFSKYLYKSLRHRVEEFESGDFVLRLTPQDHIYWVDVDHLCAGKISQMTKRLIQLPGLVRVMPGVSVEHREDNNPIDALVQQVASAVRPRIKAGRKVTFKIETHLRRKKSFYGYRAIDWNYLLGQYLCDRFHEHLVVQLKRPELTIRVYIQEDRFFISTDTYPGCQGLPVGSEGPAEMIITTQNLNDSMKVLPYFCARGLSLQPRTRDLNQFAQQRIQQETQKWSDFSQTQELGELETPVILYQPEQMTSDRKIALPTKEMLDLRSKDREAETEIPEEETDLSWCRYLHQLIQTQQRLFLYHYTLTHPPPPIDPMQTRPTMMMMLSGGIDSPVASHLLQQKFKVIGIHFSSNINKTTEIRDLMRTLGLNQCLVVDFRKLQNKIVKVVPEAYRTLMYKIMMVQVTNRLAKRFSAQLIGTGDALGQVASQTPTNLFLTRFFSRLPILAPLISWSKEEIIQLARELGTYEISIRQGTEDCCTMYLPRHPVTKGDAGIIEGCLREISDYMLYVKDHLVENFDPVPPRMKVEYEDDLESEYSLMTPKVEYDQDMSELDTDSTQRLRYDREDSESLYSPASEKFKYDQLAQQDSSSFSGSDSAYLSYDLESPDATAPTPETPPTSIDWEQAPKVIPSHHLADLVPPEAKLGEELGSVDQVWEASGSEPELLSESEDSPPPHLDEGTIFAQIQQSTDSEDYQYSEEAAPVLSESGWREVKRWNHLSEESSAAEVQYDEIVTTEE